MRSNLFLSRVLRDDRGATSIEYGLILALVCLAVVGIMKATAGEAIETWTKVETESTDAMESTVPAD